MGSTLREVEGACAMAGLPGAGTTFGRYDLTRRIGRGGMGVVYEATHRDLQRPVALKLLSMDLMDNEALRNRFIREAQALAAVDSPMIVPVFDAGEHDGWLYIATKLYPDGDLGDWIAEHGALSQDESVSVLVQVAEGLADAHEAGFLHRDIKPSNILLQRRPSGLRAVICDFGIAFAEGSEHTKTVGVIGTLGYMAPERHEGLPATAASDVYSLGCVLYACLQGRAPWVGTDVKVAMGHLYNPVPQIPEGTDAVNEVLLRALAKNPDDRYQTAAEFRQALLRLGEPVESTVIVDLSHGENLAPVAPPDLTYLLPAASTSARRPAADDTVVPAAAVAPGSTATPGPHSQPPLVPTVAEVAPLSDDTVVPRSSVVSRVAPPVEAPSSSRGWFDRRRKAWVVGAAAVLVAGGIGSAIALAGSGDDGIPVRPETLSLEVLGDCIPSEVGCSRVRLSATGLPKGELVYVRTLVDGRIDTKGCDYDDGTVKPCFSGVTSSTGRLKVDMDWAYPADLEVQIGGLSAAATVS